MGAFTEYDFLCHHGVLGMKWGVRRYQNKDGSLTAEGRKRYQDIYESQFEKSGAKGYLGSLEKAKKEKGITSISPSTDVIKKGATVKRITTENDEIDDRVKYVSILDNDSENYIDTAKNGGLPTKGIPVQKEYRIKKNIKVATPDIVVDYVMNSDAGNATLKEYKDYFSKAVGEKAAKEMVKRYGDIRVKDIYDRKMGDEVFNALSYNQYGIKDLGNTKLDKILHERVTAGQLIGRKVLRENVYSNGDALYKHFKDLGYDAIVDAEDINRELFDYPVILLNPKDSIEYVKTNKI